METNQSLGARANLVGINHGLVQFCWMASSDFMILTYFCIQDVF